MMMKVGNDSSSNSKNLIDSLTVPTLLLNEEICRRNIERMVASARKHQVRLRPHFKTHQSLAVGEWFRQQGVTCATVSSLQMARYFATAAANSPPDFAPWRDLTVAFPFNLHEIKTVNSLLKLSQMRLGFTIENNQALNVLLKDAQEGGVDYEAAVEAGSTLAVWLKLDAGYRRTGIPIEHVDEIRSLLRMINNEKKRQQQKAAQQVLEIGGILLHSGHSYNVHKDDASGIDKIQQETLRQVSCLQKQLYQEFPALEYSIGDTPSCSRIAFGSSTTSYSHENESSTIVTEIRPGNFVFYDVMQYYIGSIPTLADVAVCMACPVVAKHVERQEIVLYGGAVHMSKDSITIPIDDDDKDGGGENASSNTTKTRVLWGLVVSLDADGTWDCEPWKDAWVCKLSQEHGIIYTSSMTRFESVQVGDWLGILPIHSCLTADIVGEYVNIQTGQRVDHMRKRN